MVKFWLIWGTPILGNLHMTCVDALLAFVCQLSIGHLSNWLICKVSKLSLSSVPVVVATKPQDGKH